MDKYVKRIQSRLTYNGISLPKPQCREAYQAVVPESNWESPSDEQIAEVVGYVISQNKNDIQPEPTALTIAEPEEIAVSQPEALPVPSPQDSALSTQQSDKSAITPSIPQSEITGMVNQLFANQPPALKDQLTDYAMQHAFGDVRQVQEFLEQLRSMEFELMIQTLQDHMKRRGSMLSLLNGIISNQQHQDQESKDSFFAKTQTNLDAFRREMEARLAKQTL